MAGPQSMRLAPLGLAALSLAALGLESPRLPAQVAV
jgi:hypothetical protein